MKKLVFSIALLGLVVLTACSADSPTAPSAPPVVPAEWSIATLTVSDSNPFIEAVVAVQALVYNNGSPADDGTMVNFVASGGSFSNGETQISASTQSGRAYADFSASQAGNYVIQAQVEGVSRSVSVTYQALGGDALEIFQPLVPNVGSYQGGETVMLRGKGITAPVEVNFTVQGQVYPAIVQDIEESDPLSAPGQITVTTPFISAADTQQNSLADVAVTGGVGTAAQQIVTLPSAFTFLAEVGTGEPILYVVDPNFGRSGGGDQVNLFGRNLDNATRVGFGFLGQDLNAQILSVSADGTQVLVSTPQFSLTPLEVDELADVSISTPVGNYTLPQSFIVIADDPEPIIASLSPIAGPLDGGTLVTIFGSGFKVPVQVKFGELAATDVNVVDDQTPADNDMITCLSPDYSQQGVEPPVTVDVQVTNMLSGKISNTVGFTYGYSLFISGNSPSEGLPGDQVVIYGSGFEDPLQAYFTSGNIELEVLSISGTQLATRFPNDLPVSCSDQTGQFEVRLIDSNRTAQGGDFTLLGNSPTVTDVEPTFVQSSNNGDSVDPDDIVISGANFSEEVLVKIATFVMSPSSVTVVNENTIEVDNIPAPNDFGLQYEVAQCTTDLGDPGVRRTPSAVDVTVQNIPGTCTDTISGALIYQPEDTSCVPVPVLRVDPLDLDFGDVEVASSATQPVTVYNDGGIAMNWFATASDPVYTIDEGMGGFVPAHSSAMVTVRFSPDAEQTYDATLIFEVVEPDAIGEPQVVGLAGVGIPAP